jgi:hypothetical protein
MPSTYTPIATQTLGSAAASVTFSSITSTYTDLLIVGSGTAGSSVSFTLQFNGDTGSNYSVTFLYGDGSSAVSGRASSQTSISGMGRLSTVESSSIINIQNYSNTTTNKTVIGRGGAANSLTIASVGLWRNTAAITSVVLRIEGGGNISAGTTLTLYGIKAA